MGNAQSNGSRKISAQDRAILDLKLQRDRLHQYQRKIQVITTRETEVARLCLQRGDRSRALLALRRKKYQETLLSKTDAQLAQLEQLTGDVEFALVQKDVLFGLQRGTEVLKEIHKEIGGLEKVEQLMGDAEAQREYQMEVSALLANQMSNQDEDEVEDELEALEREVNKEGKISTVDNKVDALLPNVPTTELREREEEQDEEMDVRRRQKERARERERRVALEA